MVVHVLEKSTSRKGPWGRELGEMRAGSCLNRLPRDVLTEEVVCEPRTEGDETGSLKDWLSGQTVFRGSSSKCHLPELGAFLGCQQGDAVSREQSCRAGMRGGDGTWGQSGKGGLALEAL